MPVEAGARRSKPVAVMAVVTVIVVGAVLVARSVILRGDDDGRDPTVAAVCRVAALAEAGKGAEARRVFTNEVHGPLHVLAQEAADRGSRVAAARLLEAKEVIESSAEGPTAEQAEALAQATAAAAESVGRVGGGCA